MPRILGIRARAEKHSPDALRKSARVTRKFLCRGPFGNQNGNCRIFRVGWGYFRAAGQLTGWRSAVLAAKNDEKMTEAGTRTPARPLLRRQAIHAISDTATEGPMANTDRPDPHIINRIRSEFQEMPGMRLTLHQAARLFDLDMAHCARALAVLVTDGALWTNGREFLGRNAGRRCA